MTSKLHMLYGVNYPYMVTKSTIVKFCRLVAYPYMVICNQSAKFHDCTLSRLLEPVYI